VGATAKRALKKGERLDGEGGFTVYGKLMQTADSLRMHALPIGLAHNMVLKHDVAEGAVVTWNDVDYDATKQAVAFRKEQEDIFRKEMAL
jgi:predicted homoserine dehydrogenase-like protein